MSGTTPGVGHNSGRTPKVTKDDIEDLTGEGVVGAELTAFVERIERLEEEKKALGEDVKEIFGEIKGRGFDVKVVRAIIKARAQDASERSEQAAVFELYARAMGLDFLI